jgi:predicted DNA-binding transcriptional regulator AlpA
LPRPALVAPMPASPLAPAKLTPSDILTPEELAELFKVPVTWVYEKTTTRAAVRDADPLPYRKLGRYLRFNRSDVLAWFERQANTKKAA